MFIGGPNQRKDYHIEEGEEVCLVHPAASCRNLNVCTNYVPSIIICMEFYHACIDSDSVEIRQ